MANHLSHAGLPFPIYGCLYTLVIPFLDGTGAPVDPTTPDTEFSTNGGVTFSDCQNEITTGGGNGVGYITLSTAEMANYSVIIAAKSANAKTSILILQPAYMCQLDALPVVNPITINSIEISNATFESLYGMGFKPAGLWMRIENGLGAGQARLVNNYNPATGYVSFYPDLETQPSIGDNVRFVFPVGVGFVQQASSLPGGGIR